MRVILDTNVLVSALISPAGPADYIYRCWRNRRFTLITCREQLDEFRRVTRYPKLRLRFSPSSAGSMLNEVAALAEIGEARPLVSISSDPDDNFLLSLARSADADLLVTGDGAHLLSMAKFESMPILSVTEMAKLLGFFDPPTGS